MAPATLDERVFFKLLKQFQRRFPGYTLPDNAHAIGGSYAVSNGRVSISQQLRNALLNNSPQYQEFKKRERDNSMPLGLLGSNTEKTIDEFEREFLGLNRPPPVGYGTIFGGIERIT